MTRTSGFHPCPECGRACLALCDCRRLAHPLALVAVWALAIGGSVACWCGLARLLVVVAR